MQVCKQCCEKLDTGQKKAKPQINQTFDADMDSRLLTWMIQAEIEHHFLNRHR